MRRRSRTAAILRWVLAGYAVIGVLVALALLIFAPSPAPFRASDSPGAAEIFADPAESWSAFNKGIAAQPPVWSADEFLAAVATARGGQVVRMAATATHLDDAAITTVIKGTNVLVMVTPPTPLGAVETTRIRDNTVQQSWATPRHLQLIMVHGQEVYLPGPDLLIRRTPPAGLPMREGLRTGDVTSTVVGVAQEALAYQHGDHDYRPPDAAGTGVWTAADLRLTDTRAPTATELAPVIGVLDRGDFYADPSITPAPADHPAWAAVGAGKPVKVVVLPFADPSAPAVDWATPLAARYPQAVVLVMTGKWIESAGTDRQVMVDAINQTYGLGGFAIAASAPAYDTILDWVTGIDASAQSSHAFSRSLPVLPDTSFPRWLAYLLLATSLIIATGFVIAFLLGRRRSATGTPRERWRAQVLTGLTDAYVTLSSAPFLGRGGPDTPPQVQRRLDSAYATLLRLRGEDVDMDSSAAELVESAWTDLDAAALGLDREDAAPSSTLPERARQEPPAPRARRPRRRRVRRPSFRVLATVVLSAAMLVCTVMLFVTEFGRTTRSRDAADLTPLRTSSVASFAGAAPTTATTDAIRAVIGDRALLIAEIGDNGSKFDSIDLGDQIADAYPNVVAFVVKDGAIESASLGSDAATSGYDDYSLIDDYYGVQLEGSGDLAVARQIAMLYDRLGSSHSIRPGLRSTYDPPGPPWVLIAIGLVLAMGVAAVLVRFGTGRVLRAGESDQDERAVRDALRLRIAGLSAASSDPGDSDSGRLRQLQRLLTEVDTAPAAQLSSLSARIEELADAATSGNRVV